MENKQYEQSLMQENSVSNEEIKEIQPEFTVFADNNSEKIIEELKEHLLNNGYDVKWNQNTESSSLPRFTCNIDDKSFIQTILEEREIDYSYKLGLLASGYDASWLTEDEQLDAQVVTEDEFKRINEIREKEFKELKLPYIKIDFMEGTTSANKLARMESGTVLGFREGEELLNELNKRFNTYLKCDVTLNFPDAKENEISSYKLRYDFESDYKTLENGKEVPFERDSLSQYIRMTCSYPQVLEKFEQQWQKVNALNITDEQKKIVSDIIAPNYESLKEKYREQTQSLKATLENNKKINSSLIIDEDVASESEKAIEKVQDDIAFSFETYAAICVKHIADYLELKENKDMPFKDEFVNYANHQIKNMMQDVKYEESRNAHYGENGYDFDFYLWQKSLEKVMYASEYDDFLSQSLQEEHNRYKNIREDAGNQLEKEKSSNGELESKVQFPGQRNTDIETYEAKQKTEQIKQNFILEKLATAGIEVVQDKAEFDRILEREKLLQKMSKTQESYFQFNEDDSKKFIEKVDEWQKDSSNPRKLIVVGNIPPIMKMIGIADKPIEVEQATLNKILRDNPLYPDDKQGHKLSITDIYEIPAQLADPVMIFKSRTREDSFVFFTERKDSENRSILIPLAVNKQKGRIKINEITSMYGKDNEIDFVSINVYENNLIYADRKRYEKWIDEKLESIKNNSNGGREFQVQFLERRFTDIGTNINILTKERLVKFLEGNTKSHTQNFKQNNEVYGFAYEGKIYLNPDIMNAEVALHEYTHLWDSYTQRTNPELWQKGKDIFKNTHYWADVKNDSNYADIADNEDLLLSEVHAQICGKMADTILYKIAERDGELTKNSVIDWDKECWDYIATDIGFHTFDNVNPDLKLTTEDLKQFLSQPMKDFMSGVQIVRDFKIENTIKNEAAKNVTAQNELSPYDFNKLADEICQQAFGASASGFNYDFTFEEIASLAGKDEIWVKDNMDSICDALSEHNDEILLDFSQNDVITEENIISLNFCSVGEDSNELFKQDENGRWIRKTDKELAEEQRLEETYNINGEEYTAGEIEEALKADLIEVFRQLDSGESEENLILKAVRLYGEPEKDDAIRILVEFDSKNTENKWREDSLFNAINEENLSFNGIKVDVNPITQGKSGSIEEYLEKLEGFSREEDLIQKNAQKLEEKELDQKLNEISEKISEVNSQEKKLIPFSIINNREKGRVNIKFNTTENNPKFAEILKELRSNGWKYAPSTKQWYPVGNAVSGAEDFANKLKEKYTSSSNSVMEKPMDIGTKKSPYDGIRFFDRNYNETEDFAKYFNENLNLLHKDDSFKISEENASTILKAVGYESIGIIEQRRVRIGLDKNDKIVILNLSNGKIETQSVDFQDFLDFAKEKSMERVEQSKLILKNYRGKESSLTNELRDIFKNLYESCVEQAEEVDSKMAQIYDSFYPKEKEVSKSAVIYQRNSYRGWEISFDEDFKNSVYFRSFAQGDKNGYIIMKGKEGKDGFWQEKFVQELLNTNNDSNRFALIETFETLMSDRKNSAISSIENPQSVEGFLSSIEKIINIENGTDIKSNILNDILEPSKRKLNVKELTEGTMIADAVVSDSYKISDGVYQATLSTEINGKTVAQSYFVIENSIAQQLTQENKELVVSFEKWSVIKNKTYEPYILRELITKNLMPPREKDFLKKLDEHIVTHPLKYEKLKPVDTLNFEDKLLEVAELEKNSNKTPFELGQQLMTLVDDSEKPRLNKWLISKGCDSRQAMSKVFESWLNKKDLSKDYLKHKDSGYPPRGEK
ncbi:hypothetical protein [Treponema pectinovorum]|uniref:MuF-C-terminal domain-containing protein n=1 Tax=Treponema pectinovorum TaxID=164 RepID=UPI0011F24269|nr:hypothetical protein [Treponema pectinovorum]